MTAPITTALSLLSSLSLTLSPEDPIRASQQAAADHFSNLVSWSVEVVAVGVLLEAVEIVHPVVAWRKRKKREKCERIELQEVAEIFPSDEARRETQSHSEDPKWVKLLLRLGILLVVVGVAGEWRFGARLEDVHNDIHKYDIGKLADAEREAADAEGEAADAKERAAKLEASMMLRRLTKQQGDALCSAVPKTPKGLLLGQAVVTSSSQDWESFRYAQDIDQALRRCASLRGFNPSDRGGLVGNSFWSQNVEFGVWIRYMRHFTLDDPTSPELTLNPRKRRALAEHVRNILEANGVKIEGISDEGRAVLDIYVGPRRPPPPETEP